MSVVPERLRGSPLLVVSSLMFAVMAVSTRAVGDRLSVGQMVCARFAIGLVFLAVYFPLSGRWPKWRPVGLWAMRGVLGGASVFLYFLALQRLAVGPAVLLNSCWPLCAAVLAWVFLKEPLGGYVASGLALTSCGVVLVVWGTLEGGVGLGSWVGALAGLGSAVVGGGAVVTIRALRNETDAASVFLSFCLFGFLWGLPFAVWDWRPWSWDLAPEVLLMGVASVGAQMVFTYALAYVTAAAGGLTQQLVPVFSWVLGVVLLGEPVRPLAAVGALVCMAGVLWGTGLLPRLVQQAYASR